MNGLTPLFVASILNPAVAVIGLILAPFALAFEQKTAQRQYQQDADEKYAKYGRYIHEALDTVRWYRSLENPTSQQTVKFNMAREVLWHHNVLY